jgi:ribosomal protein S18 acetylase RimI-like enzyme
MMINNIRYISGTQEHLDEIQVLWEGLNEHHESISSHFKEDFRSFTFSQRKANLLKKHQDGEILVEIAKDRDQPVGYVISSITKDQLGEIDSIFVKDEYRGQAIGAELMNRALSWLESRNADMLIVEVAVGNEAAYEFYTRYGLYPQTTILKRKTHADS